MTDQFTPYRLPHTALKRYTDTHALPPDSTHASPALHDFGQRRAVNAIQTALDIKANGYHVFAVGENGLGKRTLITRLLAERAKHEPTPPDLVYVHNFDAPRHPVALTLPSGQGAIFAKDMHKLWHDLYKKIIAKFNSISYQNSITTIKQSAQKQERNLLDEINATAKSHNLTLLHSADQKAVFTPIDDKKPINNTTLDKLQKKLTKINIELDNLDDEVNQKIDELHETLLIKIITPLFNPILKKYDNKHDKKISQYLTDYQKDIIENILFIVEHDEDFMVKTANIPNRYYVNVAVSHTPNSGSPIVFEDMPTHPNLLDILNTSLSLARF
ncbi:AAA family ATPase [Moraxella bovis]|uniref:Lon-like protease helical domain-containing protein n=1 Tax=Moraxella bovis TaxID=476 RepID=UPI002225E172|nr:Lon-like protease helical domain-containing protein [Moraxella bovis]UZA29249.1 AAA family ATPase [Moraxella bovis]